MRLIRLSLRDFRGVDESDVRFLRDGVTVVEGPNEIGKSSLAEALDLLLTVQDSSAKAEVRDVKPVDRDVGPEVEAEIETGPYAFTYRKRFLRGHETVLRITRPRQEQLTGRQAHERVEQILGETVDLTLWRALWVRQGEGLGQAALSGATSLRDALDRAAGTAREGSQEVSLFERAGRAYEEYWTPATRKLRGDGPLRATLGGQQRALDELEEQLRRVADDVERDAELAAELGRLDGERDAAEDLARRQEAHWARIEEMARSVERLEETERAARLVAERAAEAEAARGVAIAELARAAQEGEGQRRATEAEAPELGSARTRAERAAAALSDARAAREAADAAARTARDDVEYLRERTALAVLTHRREALAAARAALADAEATVRASAVDADALTAVREADRESRLARALLEAGRPTVALAALRDVTLLVDGAETALGAGADGPRLPVGDRLVIELPEVLRVEVAAGSGDSALADRAAEAERRLRSACERAGVVDLATAEAEATRRQEALARRAEHGRRIHEILGGEEAERSDQLDARIALAERRTSGYPETRPSGLPMPADETDAAAVAQAADATALAARAAETAAELEDRSAREQLAAREARALDATIRLEMAERDVAVRREALERARAEAGDAELAQAAAAAAAGHEAAREEAAAARAALEGEGPEAARAVLENARRVVADLAERRRAAELERVAVTARLRDHGEDGLAERRDAALGARDAAAADLERWLARAEARRTLFEALSAARDRAHRAHVGPLQERLTELGRVVFGPSSSIAVDERLQIVSRTRDGQTVPYESLSAGAREQLGVLARLACAMLAADGGGVPVMLDDTLGFSDAHRLASMGAVLAMAGRSCQVIVLTCYPERYRTVGGAKTVRLPTPPD